MTETNETPPPPPALRFVFRPAEILAEPADFARMERYIPRLPGEILSSWAGRVERAGYAIQLTSLETKDFPTFTEKTKRATEAKLPIVFLSMERPDHSLRDRPRISPESKEAALRAARGLVP